MEYILAALPILALLFFMIILKWGGNLAGPVSLLICILIAALAFGLNISVFTTAVAKGLLLSFYVLLIIWPAMMLYQMISISGGINAVEQTLQKAVPDTGFLSIILAWCFSSFLEGIAGFGIPIAIVAPILVTLGISPVTAVAATAIGHAWSVTFGDMGVVFQALVGVVNMDPADLILPSSLLLGIACLLCGIAVTCLLKETKYLPQVLFIGVVMAVVQAALAYFDLVTLSGFFAGLSGVFFGLLLKHNRNGASEKNHTSKLFKITLSVYFSLSILLIFLFWPGPIRSACQNIAWIPKFNEVVTSTGFITPSGNGQILRPFSHPGVIVLLVAVVTLILFRKSQILSKETNKRVFQITWKSAAPSSIAVISTIILAAIMEHTGMTQLLANGLAISFEKFFPLVSPWVGTLGAFATGSNTSSNILFSSIQKEIALILKISPAWLVAAQTTGGALGSMLSPAKVTIGCSTVGLSGKEGKVMQITLPIGLGIGLIIGFLILIFGT
jgi:lactate permease